MMGNSVNSYRQTDQNVKHTHTSTKIISTSKVNFHPTTKPNLKSGLQNQEWNKDKNVAMEKGSKGTADKRKNVVAGNSKHDMAKKGVRVENKFSALRGLEDEGDDDISFVADSQSEGQTSNFNASGDLGETSLVQESFLRDEKQKSPLANSVDIISNKSLANEGTQENICNSGHGPVEILQKITKEKSGETLAAKYKNLPNLSPDGKEDRVEVQVEESDVGSQQRTPIFCKNTGGRNHDKIKETINKMQSESSTPFQIVEATSSSAFRVMDFMARKSWADMEEEENPGQIECCIPAGRSLVWRLELRDYWQHGLERRGYWSRALRTRRRELKDSRAEIGRFCLFAIGDLLSLFVFCVAFPN